MLSLYKVFQSIDGEVSLWGQGRMCTFIRFAGCSAKCKYCDTAYAQDPESGTLMTPEDVFQQVILLRCQKVTITGGEPLEQDREELLEFIDLLKVHNFKISIETNGLHPVWKDPNISWVMDYKLPSSGVCGVGLEDFLPLGCIDFVKFVVSDWSDFVKAYSIYSQLRSFGSRVNFAFSPVFGRMIPSELFLLMKDHRLTDCILSLQIHKLIWPNVKKGEER